MVSAVIDQNRMFTSDKFQVLELSELRWPSDLRLPHARFRLFVAADSEHLSVDCVSEFAYGALRAGAVYVCTWGAGCERFHDIIDERLVEDDVGERRFAGPSPHDTIMTTWHSQDSLEDALDFFVSCAHPSDGFAPESGFRLAVCVGSKEWASTTRKFLEHASFFA